MPLPSGAYHPLSPTPNYPHTSQRPTRSTFTRLLLSIALLIPRLAILGGLLALCLFGINFGSTVRNFGCDPDGNVWVTSANRTCGRTTMA